VSLSGILPIPSGIAKVLYENLRWQPIGWNNIEDSSVFDEHSRGFDSVRRHHASREKSFDIHAPGLQAGQQGFYSQQQGTATNFNSQGALDLPAGRRKFSN
jgi:hypothetical protein